MAEVDAETLGFALLPADDDGSLPGDDLDAAAASSLADPDDPTEEEDVPQPFGYSWFFDFAAGQFVRNGPTPARVSGLDALAQVCMMALRSARFAHTVFSEVFGMEDPEDVIGESAVDELAGDYEARVREALLVIDRVSAVDLSADFDPVQGVLFISGLTVTTDDDAELALGDLTLERGNDD